MIRIQNLFGFGQVFFDPTFLVPRNRKDPVEIIAHHGCFCRHGAHLFELAHLCIDFFACLFRKLRLLDPAFQFVQLVPAVFAIGSTQFLLDRLHLFVEVVLALRLLHLALNPAADFLLNVENRNLAFHHRIDALQPLSCAGNLKQFLLLFELDVEVARNRISKLRVVLDLCHRSQNFRRHLLVELHIAFEVPRDGARQRFEPFIIRVCVRDRSYFCFKEVFPSGETLNPCTCRSFNQDLHSLIRQFQELQNLAYCAHLINVAWVWIVITRIFLSNQEDLFVILHHFLKRPDRLSPPDEKRYNHVWKYDDVAKR